MTRHLKLSDVCKIEIGKTPPRGNPSYWDVKKVEDFPWLSIADLNNASLGGGISENKEHLTAAGAALCKPVPAGTLLMSFKLTIGRLAFTDREIRTNEAIAAITPNDPEQLSKKFLYYSLMARDWEKIAGTDVKVKGKTLNKKKIGNLPITFPELPSQEEKVQTLDKLMSVLADKRANNEDLRRESNKLFDTYRDLLLAKATEGVDEVEFGSIGNFVRGPFGGSLKKSIFVDSGYVVYEQQHPINDQTSLFRYFVTEDKFQEMTRFQVKPFDILMSCSGTFGKMTIVTPEAPAGVTNQALLKITLSKNVRPEFMKHWMQSIHFQKSLIDSVDGASLQNVPAVAEMKRFLVKVPSFELQLEIIQQLNEFQEQVLGLAAHLVDRARLLEEFNLAALNEILAA